MKEKLCISFSGGETSFYMTSRILESYQDDFEILITFANTGRENIETLEFVNNAGKYWQEKYNHSVVWLESVTHEEHGKGQTHKVVNFKTASRNGEPYEQFISVEGIPSRDSPTCSERLKTFAINSYKKSVGFQKCKTAIGIRTDEAGRRSSYGVKKYNVVYPLLDWFPSDKQDVVTFCEEMDFRLGLDNHEGNCQVCWKKSERKLWLIAIENPERFDFEKRMEKEYSHIKAPAPKQDMFGDVERPSRFFKGYKTAQTIIDESKNHDAYTLRKLIGADTDEQSGCSESCEPFQIDFVD